MLSNDGHFFERVVTCTVYKCLYLHKFNRKWCKNHWCWFCPCCRGKIVLGYTEAELRVRGSGYQFIHAADMLYCAENHVRSKIFIFLQICHFGVVLFKKVQPKRLFLRCYITNNMIDWIMRRLRNSYDELSFCWCMLTLLPKAWFLK